MPQERPTLNPSYNYKHLPYSNYSKKRCMCIYTHTHTHKSFIKRYGTGTSKKNYDFISCSPNCSLSSSPFHFSTRMFSANRQEVTMEKRFLYMLLKHTKKSYMNLSKAKYKMVREKHRKIVDLSENLYFQGKKILKE